MRVRRFLCIVFLGCLTASAHTPDVSIEPDGPPHSRLSSADRFKWFLQSTAGPASLAGGAVSSAFGTALNKPAEYGPHWEGFGKRYGMRLTGISTSNAMEAGLGALWQENPRYMRQARGSVLSRIGSCLKMTVAAQRVDMNEVMPAYARYVAIVGNNFLSNTWRTPSESDAAHAGIRVGLGFAGRAASNAFEEFWPSIRCRLEKRGCHT
jgi:hypothetical protein